MGHLRNAWYVAAWADQVPLGRPMGVQLLDEPVVLWRNTAGQVIAFEDRCLHRIAPLSLGVCEGQRLRCKYHGILYDSTGRVVEIPGQDRIPGNMRVRSYPAVERHGWVWLWMGDQHADESLIPDILDLPPTQFAVGRGEIQYAAEARLVNENLLDLSHVSFLHTETFRMSETWAREQPLVTPLPRGVRSERWIRNEGVNASMEAEKKVDTYFCSDFFVPGIVLMTSKTYPVGTADALSGQRPGDEIRADTFNYTKQAITPLTDKTSRYFYVMGDRRDDGSTDVDMSLVERTFAEDRVMIEAQQRTMEVSPRWRYRLTVADKGIVLFNKLLETLMEQESARSAHESPASAPACAG